MDEDGEEDADMDSACLFMEQAGHARADDCSGDTGAFPPSPVNVQTIRIDENDEDDNARTD